MENRQVRKNATNRSQSIDNQLLMVPPHAEDLERAILGICMLEKDAFQTASELLQSDYFYADNHQIVWKVIENLANSGIVPDILLVVEELKKLGKLDQCGGPYQITRLTNEVVSSANIVPWSQIIVDKYIQRQVLKMNRDATELIYSDQMDIYEIMTTMSSTFDLLMGKIFRSQSKEFSKLLVERLEKYSEPPVGDGLTGIPTGYKKLDDLTYGWQAGDLVIIAARPSVGKSLLGGQLAFRPAFHYKVPVAFFSIEMVTSKIIDRIIAAETTTLLTKIGRLQLDPTDIDRIFKWMGTASHSKIFFDDKTNTLNAICAEIRRLVKREGVRLVVIDYLQQILLSHDSIPASGNRDQAIGHITGKLKQLAKELGITIIVLCQLSRETEKRASKRPQLGDLRESGNIEQDADMVLSLFRQAYYDERDNPQMFLDMQARQEADLTMLKNRNGALDTIPLIFKGEYGGFMDSDDYVSYEPISARQGSFDSPF